MSTQTEYQKKLLDPRWQKKRLEIFNRDNFTCRNCDCSTDTLHVHHISYQKKKNPWEVNNDCLITTCYLCHDLLEQFKPLLDINLIKTIRRIMSDNSIHFYCYIIYLSGEKEIMIFRVENNIPISITAVKEFHIKVFSEIYNSVPL